MSEEKKIKLAQYISVAIGVIIVFFKPGHGQYQRQPAGVDL